MSAQPEKRPSYEPATRLLRPTGYDPTMARPAATKAAVALLVVRVVAGILTIIAEVVDPAALEGTAGLSADERAVGLTVFVGVTAGLLLLDALLAGLIWAGRNGPRVVVMIATTISISSAFVGWWSQGQEITIHGSLIGVGLDVLVLLALSSRAAAAYARRNERP